MTRPNTRRFPEAIAHLERRIDKTLDQCRRFEQLSAPLHQWATTWSTDTLERWLYLDHLPLEEREKALVALALKATCESGAIIDAYAPPADNEAHRLFHQVARIEWEQRHQARECRQNAA